MAVVTAVGILVVCSSVALAILAGITALGALVALAHRIRMQDALRRRATRGYSPPTQSVAVRALRETVGGLPWIGGHRHA